MYKNCTVNNKENIVSTQQKQRKVFYWKSWLLFVFCVIVAFICLFPVYVMIINATRSAEQIRQVFSLLPSKYFFSNLSTLTEKFPIWLGMFNSFFIALCSTILCVYFSALTAYGFVAYEFKAKKPLYAFLIATMLIPTQLSMIGWFRLVVDMGMYDTWWPLIIPSIASPAVFYFMYSYLQSSLPLSLVEAARIDGSGEFHTFNRIVIPIMKPAIAVQAIFTFVGSWNNYFVPALIIQSKSKMTVPILIATLRGADYMNFDMGKIYMMITVAIVPIIVVYLLLSKYIIAGVTLGGVKE